MKIFNLSLMRNLKQCSEGLYMSSSTQNKDIFDKLQMKKISCFLAFLIWYILPSKCRKAFFLARESIWFFRTLPMWGVCRVSNKINATKWYKLSPAYISDNLTNFLIPYMYSVTHLKIFRISNIRKEKSCSFVRVIGPLFGRSEIQ